MLSFEIFPTRSYASSPPKRQLATALQGRYAAAPSSISQLPRLRRSPMKRTFLLILSCFTFGITFAQKPPENPEPPNRDADPIVIQEYNMHILETQAVLWEEIAKKTNQPEQRDLYNQLAESYKLLKLYREELAQAEQNEQPFHYEKLRGQQGAHNKLLEAAVATYGEKNAPQIPPDVHQRRAPTPPPEEGAIPDNTYTTKSGFEVILKLEE